MEVIKGRMYDYNNGRFLSVDPFIQDATSTQSMNPYTYVLNNPLSGTDPTGYSRLKQGFTLNWQSSSFTSGNGVADFRSEAGKGKINLNGTFKNGVDPVGVKGAVTQSSSKKAISDKGSQEGAFGGNGNGLGGGSFSTGFGGKFDRLAESFSDERKQARLDKIKSMKRVPGMVNITAHRVGGVGPYHTALEFDDGELVQWLSAGPEGTGTEGLEHLVGGLGDLENGVRSSDAPSLNIVVGTVEPPSGLSSVQYFQKLIDASNDYCNCTDYDLFPDIADSYNSNSYVSGLIKATGGTSNIDLSRFYGGGKPLNGASFPNTIIHQELER